MRTTTLLIIAALSVSNAWSANIYWSDGDSGRINGMKFRLANVDAAETGKVNSRYGAKCRNEQRFGYRTKAFMKGSTHGSDVLIGNSYGKDRYGRMVVDLQVNGSDLGAIGVQRGYLKPWPHRDGKALAPKPDWCKP